MSGFKLSRAGIVLLKISFALQVILLLLNYSNLFAPFFSSSSLPSWLQSFKDNIAYITYISVGSCATQFFLIRLFTLQHSEHGGGKIVYLLLCLAAVVYDNWYLISALKAGMVFQTADIAHFCFFILSILILIAILTNSKTLGIICGIGALAMTGYNISVISRLIGTVSMPLVAGIFACEILYGAGLALCLFGIRKTV